MEKADLSSRMDQSIDTDPFRGYADRSSVSVPEMAPDNFYNCFGDLGMPAAFKMRICR